MTVPAIQFTPDQARTLTDVSVEALRHWRKTVPYLSTKTGKAARFTFTDVVALAITYSLVTSLGLHIGTLCSGVDALFRLLGEVGSASLEGSAVLITKNDAILCEGNGNGLRIALAAPGVLAPLTPFVKQVQHRMMPAPMGPAQAAFPFETERTQRKA